MRSALIALSSLLLVACAKTPQTNTSADVPAPATEAQRPAGTESTEATGLQAAKPATCETSSECPQGSVCRGAEGCDATWTCEATMCTRDLAPFCGCDGQTFHGSSTCPPRKFSRRGPCGPDERMAPQPKPCTTSEDCGEGETCQGPEGCDVEWTCQPARRCTRDRKPFCGCDGTTFTSSSTCPLRPYTHRGPCE